MCESGVRFYQGFAFFLGLLDPALIVEPGVIG
jgi:hypothetical protein